MNKLRFSSSGKLGKKQNNPKYCFIKIKKYQGYSSMIMPPYDLDNVAIKYNAPFRNS